MGIRFTEEEAIRAGFKKTASGDWIHVKTGTRNRNPNPLPLDKPGSSGKRKGKDKTQKTAQKPGSRTDCFSLDVICYSRKHRDPDNLCPKWYIDELVRAGVIPDDSSKFVRSIRKAVIKISKEEKERIIIRVMTDE